MRHRHTRNVPKGVELNLTPLIDMMFILLLFFIISPSFVKESGIEIKRPQAKTATPQPHGNVFLTLTPDGRIWLGGQSLDIRSLRGQLERLRADNPETSVIIQADRDARSGLLVQALDQARLAGIQQIAVATQDEPPP